MIVEFTSAGFSVARVWSFTLSVVAILWWQPHRATNRQVSSGVGVFSFLNARAKLGQASQMCPVCQAFSKGFLSKFELYKEACRVEAVQGRDDDDAVKRLYEECMLAHREYIQHILGHKSGQNASYESPG